MLENQFISGRLNKEIAFLVQVTCKCIVNWFIILGSSLCQLLYKRVLLPHLRMLVHIYVPVFI